MSLIKETLQGALLKHNNWDCSESFNVLCISLLWLQSQSTNAEIIGNVQEIIQESTPFDVPPD